MSALAASSMECVEKTTVFPVAAKDVMSAMMAAFPAGSRAWVGSSRRMASGSRARTPASESLRFSPPESERVDRSR